MSKRGFLSGKKRLLESVNSWGCDSCGLFKGVKSPKMEPYGEYQLEVMCIGDAPGKTEDVKDLPWQGKSGKFLQGIFEELDYDLFRDCISLNAVNCLPFEKDKIRTPSDHEIVCCRDVKIKPAIDKYKPNVIILFGANALQSVVGEKWKESMDGISRWRGHQIPDRDLNAWICPTYHPSFVLSKNSDLIDGIFKEDIQRAMSLRYTPLPAPIEPDIQYVEKDVGDRIRDFVYEDGTKVIAFDYETTGIKPHAEGHRIVCAAVARNEREVMVAMFPRDNRSRELAGFREVMQDERIGKIAHNMKFEHTWTKYALGVEVRGWDWDSMLATHILDNRRRVTGLKFQTYVNFGIVDYNANVGGYFKTDNSNSINSLDRLIRTERGRTELMKYCARDAVFTYNLAEDQKALGDSSDFDDSYWLLHNGTIALQAAEDVGMRIDKDYCERTVAELTDEVADLKRKFEETDLWNTWHSKYRSKSNLNSSTQLGDILYKEMGITPFKETATGKGSTDQEALEALDMDSLNLILEMRRIIKIRDTYLLSWQSEEVDGVIHPVYDLGGPTTYRSACNSPNLQNVPKRDNKAYTVCRSAIFPRKGHQFLEVDYSGIETRIAAAITGDKKLEYDAIEGDMHLDTAIEIFLLDSLDKGHKGEAMLRQAAKAFVFGQFYGGRAKDAIPILLDQIKGAKLKSGLDIYDHLEDADMVRFDHRGNLLSSFGWESHLEGVEEGFWKVRYKTYDRWKKRNWKDYSKRGYIKYPTGFYYTGDASRNETLNAIIQGSAFHVLLHAFIILDDIMWEEEWKTRLVGQIHDAIILDVEPSELEHVAETTRKVMEEYVRDEWDWINVGLEVEAELFPVDGPWVGGEKYKFKR